MTGVYGFRPGPTYQGATREQLFDAALAAPLSLASTFFDQAKGGMLESFGLGTTIKDFTIPEGETSTGDTVRSVVRLANPVTAPLESSRLFVQSFFDQGEALDQDAYKASPFFRDGIPWDRGMTTTRAAALASMDDAKKVREYYAQKRPITAFVGNLAGQAVDPINYIPIAGEAVKAAQIARFGKVAGTAIHSALDAAANTAAFGIATSGERARYGDDVSWQATVSQIATAALIGGAFGTIAGAVGRRVDARAVRAADQRLSTLKTTQEARIALNEGIDALVRGEDVNLSPNATEPLARIADEVRKLSSAYDEVRANPTGDVRDPLVAIIPDNIEGTLVGRGTFKNINEVEFSKRGWGLVKVVWGHGDKSVEPPQFRVSKTDITALPEVIRKFDPSSISRDGLRREWRVKRKGRVVVYADSMMAEKGRHLVTTYIAKTPDDMNVALSKKRPAALPGSRPQAGNLVEDTAEGRSIGAPGAGQSVPAARNIAQSVPFDKTTATPEPLPDGRIQAEASVARPDDAKTLAAQYHVDPNTGAFPEEADIAQMKAEGRLTEEDEAALTRSQAEFETGAAYAEALKSVAGCLL